MVAASGTLFTLDESNGLIVAVFALEKGLFGHEGIRIKMLPQHGEKPRQIAIGSIVTITGCVTGNNKTHMILEHGFVFNT